MGLAGLRPPLSMHNPRACAPGGVFQRRASACTQTAAHGARPHHRTRMLLMFEQTSAEKGSVDRLHRFGRGLRTGAMPWYVSPSRRGLCVCQSMPACARLPECLRVLRDFLVASAGLRASQKLATGHRSPARTPALPLAVNMMFGGLFGGATKPAVGDISQVPGGWVNPEFMRGFTFDGALPAALPPQGASSLGGVTADQLRAIQAGQSVSGPAKENQDGVVMIPDLGSGVQMYSVFDGHGENGGMVSQWSIANLPSYMAQAVQEGRAGELLNKATDAYRAADAQLETDLTYKVIEDSGTTVATALLKGDLLLVAGLGDSRVVLGQVNPDGSLASQPLTRDQSPVVAAEQKRIDASGGEVRDEGPGGRVYAKGKSYPGLAVARALGDGDGKNYGLPARSSIHMCM